jgi:putative peptide zinc metalloprotease protein
VLGWSEPWPESLPLRQRHALVLFAWVTWVYRFVVFLGIAVAVYLLFFKALGLVLFAVEIYWFILKPVTTEMAMWWQKRGETTPQRRWALVVVLGSVVVLVAWPWALDIQAHGIARPTRQQVVFSPFPAQLAFVQASGQVQAGQTLVGFTHPDLVARSLRTDTVVAALTERSREVESDDTAADQRLTTVERLHEQQAEAKAHADEVARLNLKADFDGVWLDLPPELRTGTWVDTHNALGVVVDPRLWMVEAFVEERDLARFRVGAKVRYRPHLAWDAQTGQVTAIDDTRTARVPHALDAEHGGFIATQGAAKPGAPKEALYRVRIALDAPPAQGPLRQTTGHVLIDAEPHSWLWRTMLNAMAVVVRESGF